MNNYERPNYSRISREEAVERIIQLEDAAGIGFTVHPRYGLTRFEETLLGLIVAKPDAIATKERVFTTLYGMNPDPPEVKILDVFVCKLRKKLKPLGISIETAWGRGWYIEQSDREKALLMRLDPPKLEPIEAAA